MDVEDIMVACLIIFIAFLVIGIIVGGIVSVVDNYNYGEKVGVVVNKQYYPPHRKVDERFSLELEKEINGEKRRITIYVPEYVYKEYNIGDYYGGE